METKDNYAHFLPLAVRWGDGDVLGHINNVQFIRYIESARIAYCEDVNNFLFKAGIQQGWIVADLQCSFIGQLRYPSQIEVATRTSKLGNKSAEVIASIFTTGQSEPVFTSKAVLVWFDYVKQQTLRIPDSTRNQVIAFEKITPTS